MRELKFRGKRIDNGEWAYGDLLTTRNKASFDSAIVFFDGCMLPKAESVSKETVGQYTGLKDKNGVEIYDGDIIKYTFDNPDSSYASANGLKIRISKVFWQEWRSSFAVGTKMANNDLFRYVRNGNRVEVIGNIHQNPELMAEGCNNG